MKKLLLLIFLLLAAQVLAERLPVDKMTMAPIAAQKTLDGDPGSAWTSDVPQAPGMALTVDCLRPLVLHRVVVRTGADTMGLARGLAVETSADGKAWTTAAETQTLHEPDLDLRFNPVRARHLRLRLTESAGYPWTVAEIELYGLPQAAGGPEIAIVLPDNAAEPLHWAARELQYYLTETTGRSAAVGPAVTRANPVFTLSDAPTAAERKQLEPLSDEGYLITRSGPQVRIVALSPRGVLYGCYEILDRLGVKWLDPTPEGEVVPRGAKLDLGYLPVAAKPAFYSRHTNGWSFSQMPRGWILWFVRNRLNYPGQADWWYGKLDRYLGQMPARGRHLYGHYPHSFARTLPAHLFETHPEMFPLRDGQRVPYKSASGGLQFCTTAPGTIDYVTNHVINTLKARPDQLYSLCPNDGGIWCECPDCLKLDEPVSPETYSDSRENARSVSDRFFTFMSTVCQQVEKALPGRQILTIAYSNFDAPPLRIEKMPDNLLIDVCQYGCSVHGVHECEKNEEMKRRLLGWAAKSDHIGVYDYIFDQMRVQKLPLPYCRAIAGELKWLADNNIRAFSTEGARSRDAWLYSPWAYWTLARCLWNTDRDPLKLQEEFFTAYYQEAAKPMLAYYRAMEDYAYDTPVHWGSYNNVPTAEKFSPELIARLRGQLAEAAAAAKQPVIEQRVARQVEAIDFVEEYIKQNPEQ